MRQNYGTTQWGQSFLNALGEIDTNGRLQRGKAINNKNEVYDVHITHNIVRAKVRGNYAPFYKVSITFDRFPKPNDVYEIIESNPILMADILNGELPLELLPLLRAKRFSLLPTHWREMNGSCNCPDNMNSGGSLWGGGKTPDEPCKHQAAVYFALTTAIDKDPAVLFRLRGLDLHTRFNVRTEESPLDYPLPDIPLEIKPVQMDDNDEAANADENEVACVDEPPVVSFDFNSRILSQKQLVLKALKDNPAFCSRCNMKAGLGVLYDAMPISRSKNAKKCATIAEKWESNELTVDLTVDLEQCEILWRINRHLDAEFEVRSQNKNEEPLCWSMKDGLPGLWKLGKTAKGTMSFRFASAVVSVAQTLLASHAVLPDVILCPTTPPLATPPYRIIWKPLSSTPEVKELLDKLVALHDAAIYAQPEGIVFLKDNNMREAPLAGESAVLHAISCVLNATMYDFIDFRVPKNFNSSEANAFFTGRKTEIDTSGVATDVTRGIRNWLRLFDLLKAHLAVRLVIEIRDAFLLKIVFGEEHLPLPDYIKTCSEEARAHTYQFVSALNAYLPKGSSDHLTMGEECLLSQNALEDFMIDCAPTLSALGVELVLPRQLEKMLKPRVVVRARGKSTATSFVNFQVDQDVLSFDYRPRRWS